MDDYAKIEAEFMKEHKAGNREKAQLLADKLDELDKTKSKSTPTKQQAQPKPEGDGGMGAAMSGEIDTSQEPADTSGQSARDFMKDVGQAARGSVERESSSMGQLLTGGQSTTVNKMVEDAQARINEVKKRSPVGAALGEAIGMVAPWAGVALLNPVVAGGAAVARFAPTGARAAMGALRPAAEAGAFTAATTPLQQTPEQKLAELTSGEAQPYSVGDVVKQKLHDATMGAMFQGGMQALGKGAETVKDIYNKIPFGDLAKASTYAMGSKGYVARHLQSLFTDPAVSAASKKAAAVSEAEQKLAGGSTSQESMKTGEAVKAGTALELKAAEKEAQARLEKTLAEQKGTVETAAKTQAKAEQKLQQATENQAARQAGLGEKVDRDALGKSIVEEVASTSSPVYKARSEQYGKEWKSAVESAKQKEDSGNFFSNSPMFKAIEEAWKAKANKMTTQQSEQVNAILRDIKTGRVAETQPGQPTMKLDPATQMHRYETPNGQKPDPKSLEGVDAHVRLLSDKGYLNSEGGKAIGEGIARDLSTDLKNALRQWHEPYGVAKDTYSKMSGDLAAWETKLGKKVQETEGRFTERTTVDPEKIGKAFFSTKRGYQDLVEQLGGDTAKAAKYAEQHAINELSGKNAKQASTWLEKNEWVPPDVRVKLNRYANNLERGEKVIAGRQQQVGEATKSVSEAQKQLEKTAEKGWAADVDKYAQEKLKMIGQGEFIGKNAENVIGDILTGKNSRDQLMAIGHHIGNNPAAREAFPGAVRQALSGASSPNKAKAVFDSLEPALEKSGLMSPTQLASLKHDVEALVAANNKNYAAAEPARKAKITEATADGIAKRLARYSKTTVLAKHSGLGTNEE